MLYGEGLYLSDLYESQSYTATWENAYQFTYLAGTTVSVTPTLVASIPVGTSVEIWAGETTDEDTQLFSGSRTAVLFESSTSGLKNLYVKIIMRSTAEGLTPTITSLGLLIEQSTSLYTIATQILADALTDSGGTWEVDTELQKYLIPYAWFDAVKHRYALGKVAEAAGGVAFQDRLGAVRVQAGNYILRQNGTSLFDIDEDRIIDAESPVSEVKNHVIIKTKPYTADSSTTVWELSGDNIINNGESKTYQVYFSDYDAVIDASSTLSSNPAGATITAESFYSWGASITVLGSADNQELTLSILGKPLVIRGARVIEGYDSESIRRNGDRTLTLDDNSMIQSAQVAEEIAEDIIATTAEEKRDIVITWRGDPTIELGDKGVVTGFDAVVVEQQFTFDGALRATARLRRV